MNAILTATGCTFTGNEADRGSIAYIVANNDQLVTFTSCTFRANKGEGCIYMYDAALVITGNTFDSNLVLYDINGIIGVESEITSTSNVFKNQVCEAGCYFHLFQRSDLTDTNSIITSAENNATGGVIKAVSQCTMTLTGTKISNCKGEQAPISYLVDQCTITLTNVEIDNVIYINANDTPDDLTGLFALTDSHAYINSSTITNSEFRFMYVSKADNIQIIETTISQMTQDVSGAVLFGDSIEQLLINKSTFANNSCATNEGGVLYIKGSNI